jgi:hypothetical protein
VIRSRRPRLCRHRPQEAAQHPAGALRGAGRQAGLRNRCGFADADFPTPTSSSPATASTQIRRSTRPFQARHGETAPQPLHLAGHAQAVRRLHLHLFEKTEHGWFQAHVYKFDATPPPSSSSARARLAGARPGQGRPQDGSIAFCEKLFAKHLQGHPLMSNARHLRGSAWLNFQRVLCEQWHLFNGKPRGADGRRGAHGALRHRLGHQAGDGGRHRADAPVQAAKEMPRHPAHMAGVLARYQEAAQRRGAQAAERGAGTHGVVRGGAASATATRSSRAVHVLACSRAASASATRTCACATAPGSKATSAGSRSARGVAVPPLAARCSRLSRCAA